MRALGPLMIWRRQVLRSWSTCRVEMVMGSKRLQMIDAFAIKIWPAGVVVLAGADNEADFGYLQTVQARHSGVHGDLLLDFTMQDMATSG